MNIWIKETKLAEQKAVAQAAGVCLPYLRQLKRLPVTELANWREDSKGLLPN